MPAVMPAVSWSPAREAPIWSTEVPSFSNEIGNAPNFRLVARLFAEDEVKSPEIWALPSEIRLLKTGAEITRPSSTIAKRCSEPAIEVERSVKTPLPSPPRLRSTTQLTSPCGMPAEADFRSGPSMTAGESRYFVAASSPAPHVTSQVSGSSTGALSDGQV